ncbi:MAG: TonB-dependent receptor, partial [Bacteroidota bacterium]
KLGFFSTFNTDVIQNVTLYKGHIPAAYGGRLSSALDINLRDGNDSEFHGKGGIGLFSGRLTLEGPLVKQKTSALISVRSSLSDWLFNDVRATDINLSAVSFYDGLAKLSQYLPKGKLTLSAYWSNDFFRFAREFGFKWDTKLYNLEWQHTPNDEFAAKTKINYGSYNSAVFEPDGPGAFQLDNGLWYVRFRQDFNWVPEEKHEINFGLEGIHYDSYPEVLRPEGEESTIEPMEVEKGQARELAIYASDKWQWSERLSVSLGLRYSFFQNFGPRKVFDYVEGRPLEPEYISGSTQYESGEIIQSYGGLEPRFSARYTLSETQSVKFSYNRMRQYIHLISNTTAATPADVWQFSNRYIPPQKAHNFSVGYFHNSKNNNWENSFEVYYRTIKDMVAYKDLPELLLNPQLETELLAGEGLTYGFEISTERKKGRWSGRISYAWSRSLLRARGDTVEE